MVYFSPNTIGANTMLDALASHLDAFAALAPVWGYAFIFAFMAIMRF